MRDRNVTLPKWTRELLDIPSVKSLAIHTGEKPTGWAATDSGCVYDDIAEVVEYFSGDPVEAIEVFGLVQPKPEELVGLIPGPTGLAFITEDFADETDIQHVPKPSDETRRLWKAFALSLTADWIEQTGYHNREVVSVEIDLCQWEDENE